MSIGEYPGLYEGLQIERRLEPEDWRAAVDQIEDPEVKAGAERYLAGIVQLRRNMIRFAKECGCRNLEEFERLKKLAKQHGAPGARAWLRAGRPLQWRHGRQDDGDEADENDTPGS